MSSEGARSAGPVLMLSGGRGVILHLSGPAVGAGTRGDTAGRGESVRGGRRELGEAHSNQGEEKQAHNVIVTEPLNTAYKQARTALGMRRSRLKELPQR